MAGCMKVGCVVAAVLGALFFVMIVFGFNRVREADRAHKATVASAPAEQISPTRLVQAYVANEVAADEKYKGKPLEVNGRVVKIGKDIINSPYVVLATQDAVRQVRCMFTDEHTAELSKLSVNQTVTIRGECRGLMMNVLLEGCSFVKR